MNFSRQNMTGLVISFTLHFLVLAALSLVVLKVPLEELQMMVESAIEERVQEEFSQDVEESTQAAETVNYAAGSMVSGSGAGGVSGGGDGGIGGAAVSISKVDNAPSLKEPVVRVNIGTVGVPGLKVISNDLGSGQVAGEVGRVVEGYGAALGQMTQEVVRLMRQSKVHVVWLFDESESMKDDQKEIRERFYKVYEELGLVQKHDGKFKASDEVLMTSVVSFGQKVTEHTRKPTANVDEIKTAIDEIKIDESGLEMTCMAINSVVTKYQAGATRQGRKLVLIVVTDESGDDGKDVEETIQRCKNADAPVYVLGHLSVFGFPYARMRWIDPKYNLEHWLLINRGPETPQPECLQFDGLTARWDVFSSGFGPYEQVRIAKETGGIFFMLPGNEDNLVGEGGSLDARKFDLLDMKEYLPDLSSRTDYIKSRSASKFRDTQWRVISTLNPFTDKELGMQTTHYSLDSVEFGKQGKATFDKALRAMGLLNEAVLLLDSVKKLRDKESSERWRANYDLMHAQCLAYRVRLFQLLLALDDHQKSKPVVKDPKSNYWDIRRVHDLLEPDKEQIRQTKVDMKELKGQLDTAKAEFKAVIENHPRTPWARRAEWELAHGFALKFGEAFWDPRYRNTDIKLPKP